MKLRDVLREHLIEIGVRDPEAPGDEPYLDDWFRIPFRGESYRFARLGSHIDSLAIHDLHHLLNGYDTSVRGEAEVVGWELASGGCGRHWVLWIDRLGAIPLMLFHPRASWRAIKKGFGERNLYRFRGKEVLEFDRETALRAMRQGELPARSDARQSSSS